MSDIDQTAFEPISFAGGILDRFRHVCAFINTRDEGHRILDPFVSGGLTSGERLLYIVNPNERADVVRRLRHLGHDVPSLLEQGRCVIRTWNETYLRGGHFDPDAMVGVLDRYLGGPRSPRVRMVTDMGWAAADETFSDHLLEYEAQANTVYPKHEHVVICVYDIAKFDADLLVDVLRTHPMALIGNMLQVNPFFVPAAEFLAELRSREPRPVHG